MSVATSISRWSTSADRRRGGWQCDRHADHQHRWRPDRTRHAAGITAGRHPHGADDFSGTLTDLNNYFNTASNITVPARYTHTNGDNADTIQVEINDNGNTGTGGGTNINLGTTNVDIAAVNDDPTNAGTLPTDIAVTEDVSSNVDLSAVDFSDVDAAAGSLTVTLTTSTGGDLSAAAGTRDHAGWHADSADDQRHAHRSE